MCFLAVFRYSFRQFSPLIFEEKRKNLKNTLKKIIMSLTKYERIKLAAFLFDSIKKDIPSILKGSIDSDPFIREESGILMGLTVENIFLYEKLTQKISTKKLEKFGLKRFNFDGVTISDFHLKNKEIFQ